ATSLSDLAQGLDRICAMLAETRPTAVNLFWALERMKQVVATEGADLGVDRLPERLHREALAILEEDIAMNKAIGRHGVGLFPAGARILTHCNTGSLATGGYGTALGIIRACHERAKRDGCPIHVWVDETRPYFPGARLTAWE